MNNEKQKFLVIVSDVTGNATALATILDNEEHWEPKDAGFKNIVNDNISLCIVQEDDGKALYEYTLTNLNDNWVEIADLITDTIITDKIKASNLVELLKTCDDCEVVKNSVSNTVIKTVINGQELITSSTKLVSIGNNSDNHKLKFSIKVDMN